MRPASPQDIDDDSEEKKVQATKPRTSIKKKVKSLLGFWKASPFRTENPNQFVIKKKEPNRD